MKGEKKMSIARTAAEGKPGSGEATGGGKATAGSGLSLSGGSEQVLMIPGPTPVPQEVLREVGKPMINHRGPEFAALIQEAEEDLKKIFGTSSDVLILTSSGTGGMEAAIVNALSPGDHVLACPTGVFGERFIQIARAYGAEVQRLETRPGEAADPEALKKILREDKEKRIRAILLTQNETSTGVENPVRELARARDGHPALVIVDAVSSLGATPLKTDEWGLDLVVSASQKALMCPPGLAFVAVSQRGWEARENSRMPKFYFDLESAKKMQEKGQTPFTPALSILFGLRHSLKLLLEEGLERSFRRHQILSRSVQEGVRAMGLSLFASSEARSKTVTAIQIPEGVDIKKVRERVRKEYGVVIAGGQGELADKIFRIGHLGHVGLKEVLATLAALESVLSHEGMKIEAGSGVRRAQEIFMEER